MNNDQIYVYCISNSLPDFENDNGLEALKTLIADDFYIIIKYVSESEFSEENFKKNLSDIQWVETNAREHIRVISLIMEHSTVIPFRFGTIYHSETSLKKFITDYSDSLIENFHHIDGKEEWAVKVYCDRKVLEEQIDELSEEAASLEKQIMESSPGKAFLLKRKKIDLTENEIDRLCKVYGQKYFDEFESLSESTCLNNLLPKEFTGRQDSMILNATFLISKDKVTEFTGDIGMLRKRDGSTGFIIESTGPWPPFSFINMKESHHAG